MTSLKLTIHERLTELADATRCRLLLALEPQELTVGELCSALQLPQSTVSRHLKILADERWVTSRADGASRWYGVSPLLAEEAASLWALVRAPMYDTPAVRQDVARVDAVLAARRTRSEAFFADVSDEWDILRTSMFGARADLLAAFALCEPSWQVADLGCGTGALSAALAPHVAHVHAVDTSTAMLSAARARLQSFDNVTIHDSTLERLPFADASLDVAVMMFVLHHVADPARALRETRRVLRPNGRLLIADMRAHTRAEYQQQMGHVWLGFDEPTLRTWVGQAGFDAVRYTALPVDTTATGPAMFSAIARTTVARTVADFTPYKIHSEDQADGY